MKIMSKSPSRHLVRLQGILKLTEKEKKINIFACFITNFGITMYKLSGNFSG